MKIATFNINGIKARIQALPRKVLNAREAYKRQLLREYKPASVDVENARQLELLGLVTQRPHADGPGRNTGEHERVPRGTRCRPSRAGGVERQNFRFGKKTTKTP